MSRSTSRKLGFESLETRRLLAVTVSNTPSGDLLVAGDSAADTIIITENELGTQWEIGGNGTVVTSLVADVDPIRPGLQILKPTTQNVLIQSGGGNDALWMLNINQGAGANAVAFVGQTTIDMGSGRNTTNLGAHPDQVIVFPNLPDTDSDIISSALQGSRANQFIGAVSVTLGGSVGRLEVRNTDFGGSGAGLVAAVAGHLQVIGTSDDDTIAIHDSNNFGGSFDIDAGAGGDVINVGQFGAVTLGGNLNIHAGDGHDRIELELALTVGNITVRGGYGDDFIRLGSSLDTPPASRVGSSALGDIVIYGGDFILLETDGNDRATINQATTAGALHVNLGTGALFIVPPFAIVAPEAPGNYLFVANSSFSKATSISGLNRNITFNAVNAPLGLYIQASGGGDRITILGTLVELGVTSIVTGGGNNIVQIGGGSRFQSLQIVTGDGNDFVGFGDSTAVLGNASVAEFFLDLGAGDDSVDSADSTFGRAVVHGGSGVNTRSGQAFSQDNDFDMLFFEGFGA